MSIGDDGMERRQFLAAGPGAVAAALTGRGGALAAPAGPRVVVARGGAKNRATSGLFFETFRLIADLNCLVLSMNRFVPRLCPFPLLCLQPSCTSGGVKMFCKSLQSARR